jgi:outer membrane protein OmpA-like peptidoglycan-associated protein
LGGKDIYKVIFLGSEKELLLASENSRSSFFGEKPVVFVKPLAPIVIDSSLYMKGRILDSETNEPIVAKLNIIDSDKGAIVATIITGPDGAYTAKLSEKKMFGVEITARGYLFYLDVVDLKKEPGDQINKDFMLNKLEIGAKVVLKNIFFETGKANLLSDSYQQLDNVIVFLKDNPTVKLEVSGHTDNVGSRNSNMKLSQNRAKAVNEYLIGKGIDKGRLESVGYGPDQPIGDNKTAEGKAQNRRVEFKITGK